MQGHQCLPRFLAGKQHLNLPPVLVSQDLNSDQSDSWAYVLPTTLLTAVLPTIHPSLHMTETSVPQKFMWIPQVSS